MFAAAEHRLARSKDQQYYMRKQIFTKVGKIAEKKYKKNLLFIAASSSYESNVNKRKGYSYALLSEKEFIHTETN